MYFGRSTPGTVDVIVIVVVVVVVVVAVVVIVDVVVVVVAVVVVDISNVFKDVSVAVDQFDFFQLDDRKLSTFGFLGGKGKVKLRENEVIVNLLD